MSKRAVGHNIFQLTYDARLVSWYELRAGLEKADTETKCIAIDDWWQRVPLVNHYLHQHEISAWPGPWELLSDNTYCTLARGLGMCYTLSLTGVKDVDFCLAIDDNSEEVSLVLVEDAKYLLNYYPDTVLSNTLKDFKITDRMDLSALIKKIN